MAKASNLKCYCWKWCKYRRSLYRISSGFCHRISIMRPTHRHSKQATCQNRWAANRRYVICAAQSYGRKIFFILVSILFASKWYPIHIGGSSRTVVRAHLGVIRAHCLSTAHPNTWPRTNEEELYADVEIYQCRRTWRWRSQPIFHPSRHTRHAHYILINEWLRQKQKKNFFVFIENKRKSNQFYTAFAGMAFVMYERLWEACVCVFLFFQVEQKTNSAFIFIASLIFWNNRNVSLQHTTTDVSWRGKRCKINKLSLLCFNDACQDAIALMLLLFFNCLFSNLQFVLRLFHEWNGMNSCSRKGTMSKLLDWSH